MATYYLSPSGSDSTGTGTSGNPWKTIAYADTQIIPGDTVRLKAGTYTLNASSTNAIVTNTSGTSGSHITWTADVVGTVFLVSSGTSTTLWRSKGSFVDHIGLNFTSSGTALAYGLVMEGSTVSARNCVAHDIAQNACSASVGGAGIYAGNATYTNTHVDITECKTYNIGPSGCYYTHGIFHCVQFGNVYNNISFGNGGQGIQYHHNAGNSNCANNLCFNNDHGGIFVGNTGADGTANAANMLVENNICLNNGGCNGGLADSNGAASNNYKNNCSFNNLTGNIVVVSGTKSGNIQVDPLLVNYQADGSGNYRLKTGSPCINGGITAGAPTIDYDGIARGSTVDIGPYEFKPGGARTIPTTAAFSGLTSKTRTVPTTAAFSGVAPGRRDIPTTASLSVLHVSAVPALSLHLPGPSDIPGLIGSLTTDQRIDDPAAAAFTVPDFVGISAEAHQAMEIIDDATGSTLFSGFVDQISDQALPGNTAILMRAFTCTGNRWRAEKRVWTGQEFGGWVAGDALAKFHQDVLGAEGVRAAYALDHDNDQSSFGQGTLAGVVATPAGLTLATSGTDYNKDETNSSDFSAGTLTFVSGASGSLSLVTYTAIKFVGTAGTDFSNSTIYTSFKVWQAGNLGYTFATGDTIALDCWIASTSPEAKFGIDMLFSDGTWMHDFSTDFQDQEVIPMVGDSDLSGWAIDQWYTRVCTIQAARAGKTVMGFYLTIRGTTGGDYVGYFKNIIIANASGVAQRTIFGPTATSMSAKVKAGSNGYSKVGATVVTVYDDTGTRVSPAYDLSAVGIVKGSMISWGERDAAQPTTGANQSYPPQVQVATSIDNGATWQACANHSAIPSLILGMNTAGVSLLLQQTLSVGGPLPEIGPFLDTCSFQVYSAAACTKTDYKDIDATTGALNAGTLNNATSYSSGLKTTGDYHDWQTHDLTSMTLYGPSGAGNPEQGIQTNFLFLRTDGGLNIKTRFDFTTSSTYANFIAEIDVHIVSSSSGNEYELLYRTTAWNNNNHTYAYAAGLTATTVLLQRGSNSGTGALHVIASVTLSLNVGDWYRLKVVANGSNHKVFVNDVKFIDATDATFTGAGYLGVRYFNGGAGRDSGHFNNFAVIAYEADFISVSSRVTPALPLGGLIGDSRIYWDADVPDTSDFLVEATLNGGTSWATCTNGEQIPALFGGYNAAGKSLQVRFSMTNQTVNQPIALHGYSAWVIGAFHATGTRISPALDLSTAGSIGSSSVTWNADTDTGSSVAVSTSLDAASWTAAGASPSTIAGLIAQGPMLSDDFDFDSSAQYSRSSWAGGASPIFVIDTANSSMTVTSGTNGLLTWTQVGAVRNVYLELVTSQCEQAGLFFRAIDADNLYYVIFNDDNSGSNPGTVEIRKRVAGVDSQVFAPIAMPDTFTRGMYHALQVSIFDNLITCSFDGVAAASINDASLGAAGSAVYGTGLYDTGLYGGINDAGLNAAGTVGIYHNSSVSALWFNFRAQQQGDNATELTAYSQLALASTDPTQNPVVKELVISVRNPNLMTGALLDATQYADKAISDDIADAAGRSKMYWRIDGSAQLVMMDRAYSPAPWPLDAQDPLFLGVTNPPSLVRRSPSYRNRQYVTGAIDLQTVAESKKGDGSTQSWPLAYPIDSLVSIKLDKNPQTFGVQGVDAGVNFYYQPGQNTLSADASLFPEDKSLISVTYIGRVPYRAMKEDQGQQLRLQGIDGTTGIVEKSEDCGGLPAAAADAIAQARIDEYAILDSSDWTYSTARPGLQPGHFQSIFVPQHGMHDTDVLITAVKTTPWLDSDGLMHYDYDITATTGANLGVWQRIFKLAT